MGSKITPSSGNVFADLGFEPEEAEHLLIRSDLMIVLKRLIEERKLASLRREGSGGGATPKPFELRGR